MPSGDLRPNRVVPVGLNPLAIVGATATGKSALAMALARLRGDVELVSVDSMQVYRGMDIGTAKPTVAEQGEVRHHVIDLVDPWEPFEVRSFQEAVAAALADIAARGRRAVLVGGTGLYLRAVVDGFDIPGRYPEVRAELEARPDTPDTTADLYRLLSQVDPAAAQRMDAANHRRIVRALEVTIGGGRPFSSYGPGLDAHPPSPVKMVGLAVDAETLASRIEARYHRQMADGFLDEVRSLHRGPTLSRTAGQALGYRELLAHLDDIEQGGTQTLEMALDEAIRRTRIFARRQRSWFRRDPRIAWIDSGEDEALDAVATLAEEMWGRA